MSCARSQNGRRAGIAKRRGICDRCSIPHICGYTRRNKIKYLEESSADEFKDVKYERNSQSVSITTTPTCPLGDRP
jgi:hypothetical protein